MKKLSLSDFTGGMVQRISPEDYNAGEWGLLKGFVPEDDKSIRSQWGIQNVGAVAESWTENGAIGGVANTAHLTAVYPIRSASGVYLVAIKQDGTVWWSRAADGDANYVASANTTWKRVIAAQNQGYEAGQPYTTQPEIFVESNPDYRFICEVPLEIYK